MAFDTTKADRGGVVLHTNSGLVNTGTINGDVYIINGNEYPLLTPNSLFRKPRQDHPLSLLSSAVLSPLIGREQLFAELMSWCLESGGGIRGTLLHGGGGLGKSRLAHELACTLDKEHGWLAGGISFKEEGHYRCGEEGNFWIIDYAEEQLDKVKQLLEKLAESEDGDVPHRLLLLSRNGPEFWQPILDAHAGDLFSGSHSLGGLEQEGNDYELFSTALKEAATRLKKEEPTTVNGERFKQWQQSHDNHRRPLFILAYALNLVEDPTATNLDGEKIIDALNRRERKRLTRLGEGSAEINSHTLERLLFIAAINNGLNPEQLRELAAQPELELGLPAPEQVVDLLNDLGVLVERQLPAPSPDILAAHWLHTIGASSDRCGSWIATALCWAPKANFTILGRQLYDLEQVLGLPGEPLVQAVIRVVEVETALIPQLLPGLWVQHLAHQLLPLAMHMERWQVEHSGSDEVRAGSLNNLSGRLNAMGDREGALAAIEKAVGLYRQLAEQRPEIFTPLLATSLNNFANRLYVADDPEGALTAIEEAVKIRRQLVWQRPEAFTPDLAMSLNDLSNHLNAKGDRDGALAAIEEAVKIYRQLAQQSPEVFNPDLAMSLNNLSIRLSDGKREGALASIDEAVELYRQLVEQRPEIFNIDLARSLAVQSQIYADLNGAPNAIKSINEAIELITPAAEQYPQRQVGTWLERMKSLREHYLKM